MKKLSFLFVSLALVGFIALSSCKSSTQPTTEPATEEVEEAPAEAPAVADTAVAPAEDVAE